jgi:hypothetical protein
MGLGDDAAGDEVAGEGSGWDGIGGTDARGLRLVCTDGPVDR